MKLLACLSLAIPITGARVLLAQTGIPTEAYEHGGFFVITLVILYGIYRLIRYLLELFGIPLRDRFLTHLDSVDTNLKANTATLVELKNTCENFQHTLSKNTDVLQAIKDDPD